MQHKAKSRKRKGINGANKKHRSESGGIDKLPNDVLINIVSRMSFKEAVRASVLARRWRHLWKFFHGTLRFDDREKFESWVNGVMDLHQGPNIDGMIISFEARGDEGEISQSTSRALGNWLFFAMQKEVQTLEMSLSLKDIHYKKLCASVYRNYRFPITLNMLRSHSHAFCRLRSLRLAHVVIMARVVHYFLASFPNLEELCIQWATFLFHLQVVDPPSLRVLELTGCPNIKSLEISAETLVSLTYGGRKNSLLLKKAPNLRELTVRDDLCMPFLLQPNELSSYSVQLEKLVLDFRLLNKWKLGGVPYSLVIFVPPDLPRLCSLKRLHLQVHTHADRSFDFTSLIEASPQLCEFRIELSYSLGNEENTLPSIIRSKFPNFVHGNLKVIEMSGYIGCRCSENLLRALVRKCPSIERLIIDIATDFYDDPQFDDYIALRKLKEKYGLTSDMGAKTLKEAEERVQRFVSSMLPLRKVRPTLRIQYASPSGSGLKSSSHES